MQPNARETGLQQRRLTTAVAVGAALCLGVAAGVLAVTVTDDDGATTQRTEPSPELAELAETEDLETETGWEDLSESIPADPGLLPEPVSPLEAEPVAGEEEPAVEETPIATEPAPEPALETPIPPPTATAPAAPAETTGAGGAAPEEEYEVEEVAGVPCGNTTCAPGLECCNESCGTCVSPGETCSQYTCSMRPFPVAQECGSNTCNVDEVCCNASCGTCVRPGETCDTTPCPQRIQQPISYMCGMTTCNVGMVCCNPSCGLCAPPGQPCSQELCD